MIKKESERKLKIKFLSHLYNYFLNIKTEKKRKKLL